MIMSNGETITMTDRYRSKFGSATAEVAYEWLLDGGADDDAGSTESPAGFAARFGRHILFEDSRGFVDIDRHATIEAAEHVMDELHQMHRDWEEYDESDDI